MTRKVYRLIPKAGNIDNLKLKEEELPAPGENEVQIKVKSIGLNFADIFAILGLYSATPEGSFVPGLEYAGDVIAIGKNVEGISEGDRVMGVTRFGGYTDHLNIDHNYVTPLPAGWTYDEGAAFPVQALTAYYALIPLADIKPEQTVLIHSAAGGVGLQANRIAKKFNAYTIGTVGSDKKIELLKSEGYDDWIVRSDNFREDLKEKLGDRELNIVLDCIGGQIFKDGFRLLAPEGRMIVYGSAHFASTGKKPNYFKLIWKYLKRPKIDPMRLTNWNKSVMGFNLIYLYDRKGKLAQYIHHLQELNIDKPFIGHTFEFDELLEAIRLFQTGKTTGKIVVHTT